MYMADGLSKVRRGKIVSEAERSQSHSFTVASSKNKKISKTFEGVGKLSIISHTVITNFCLCTSENSHSSDTVKQGKIENTVEL